MTAVIGAKSLVLLTVAAVAAGIPIGQNLAPETDDGGSNAANKTQVAASTMVEMSAPIMEGATSEEVSLLSTSIKTAKPQDLVFQVTLECALWTDVSVTGNGESTAVASVLVWIEFDGETLAVAGDEDPASDDFGRVVFCNRHFQQRITDLDDEDARFETFLRTRSANAFNWIEIDAGSATHTVEVKAQLEAQVDGVGFAQAAVGKRTLVVEPVHLANGATL